jgi:hypothetical protein
MNTSFGNAEKSAILKKIAQLVARNFFISSEKQVLGLGFIM